MPYDQKFVELTHGDPTADLWLRGRVKSLDGYRFVAKVFDGGSQFGICGGRVSKLTIKHRGDEVLNYERGWDLRPRWWEMRHWLALWAVLIAFR